MIALGLPPTPLPARWWLGLPRRHVLRVVRVELYGAPSVQPTPHEKGYVRVYLGRRHPYADRSGSTYLHRWLVCRREGRRLETYEHVHHKEVAEKTTLDETMLEVRDAIDHGQLNYGVHFIRRHGRLEFVSCGREYCAWELELEAMAREADEL